MRVPVSTIGATIRFGYGWKFGVRKRFGQPWRIDETPFCAAKVAEMTIPQVVDGVTDADAAFMNQLVDAANQANAAFNGAGQITTAAITPALEGYGPLANMRAGMFDPRDAGALGDGDHDDTSAILSKIDEAYEAGDATDEPQYVTLRPGRYLIDGELELPDIVGLRGSGSGITTLVAASSGAKITLAGGSRSSASHGGWTFDGDEKAEVGLQILPPFYESVVSDIVLDSCDGDGLDIRGTQNTLFQRITSHRHQGNGIVVDDGAGSLLFQSCFASNNVTRQVRVQESGNYPELQGTAIYTTPRHIKFDTCVFERGESGCDSIMRVDDGFATVLTNTVLAAGSAVSGESFPVLMVTGGDVVLGQRTMIAGSNASNHDGILVSGNGAVVFADPSVTSQTLKTFLTVDGASARAQGFFPGTFGATTPVAFTGGASETSSSFRFERFNVWHTQLAAANAILSSSVQGDAGQRFRMQADGKMLWDDGADFSFDTNLYRSAANLLKTDDAFAVPGTYTLPFWLGSYALWVNPGDGKLYIKSSAPGSATDGTVVGSQS